MHRVLRLVASYLVLSALMLRALVPAGFMLTPSAIHEGTLTFVMCVGGGSQMGVGQQPGEFEPDGTHNTTKGLCAFAAAVAVAVLPEPIIFAASISYFIAEFAPRSEPPTIRRYEQPRSARGPPLLG